MFKFADGITEKERTHSIANTGDMLIALIFIVWISLIAIFWAVCGMAKRGDAELESDSRADLCAGVAADDGYEDVSQAGLASREERTEPRVRDARHSHTSSVR